MYSVIGCDAQDWERVGASKLSSAFSTGATDDDINHARAIVLKANNHSPCSAGGILFTVEEMDEKEKAEWKAVWMDMNLGKDAIESDVDFAMARKNRTLYWHKGGAARPDNK